MKGIIIKGVGGQYLVKEEITGELHTLYIRGKFRNSKISPLPGDVVEFKAQDREFIIDKIYERKNELIRPAIANITQVFLVFALKNPDINWDLINGFLLMVEDKGIEPIIIFNKSDLEDDGFKEKIINNFINTSYRIKFISALNRENIDDLKEELKDNITVLAGPSGVGKSTLLNAILGKVVMKTGDVSTKIGRGKHTTRHTELIEVEGGLLADTPGFSNIETIKVEPTYLMNLFPEFKDFIGECKFNTCQHINEPKCKVKEEVGIKISELRYDFYKRTYNILKEGEKRKWD